jgi:hypothetical protein
VPEDFTGEFRKYLKLLNLNGVCTIPLKTRAQINLLFAIGAKYSHLIGATWAGEKDDHLEYMARAIRLLGLKETIMILSEPDIQMVHAVSSYQPSLDSIVILIVYVDGLISLLLSGHWPCE